MLLRRTTALAVALLGAALTGTTAAHAQQAPKGSFNWTGFYIGANAGVTWGSAQFNPVRVDPNFIPEYQAYLASKLTTELNDAPSTIGGQAGYNVQFGFLVLGIEGDVERVNFKASRDTGVIPGPFPAPGHNAKFSDSVESDTLYTLRGRIGTAFDRLLIYGTAGWAWADISARRDYDLLAGVQQFRSSTHGTDTGWVLGAGLEYALTKNLTIKGEYLFVNFDNAASLTQSIPLISNTSSLDLDFHMVRVGINYKF